MKLETPDTLTVLYPYVTAPQVRSELDLICGGRPEYIPDPKDLGSVIISREWLRQNMVMEWFPILGMRYVNHLMVIPLWRALTEIDSHPDENVREYLKPDQCGIFCPRHKMRDTTRSLSLHAYGMAIDLNWNENKYGKKGTIERFPEVIQIFKKWGFSWGGDWHTLDMMHFQYAGKAV